MRDPEEFARDFVQKLENMKKYQGIDIMNPSTYGGNRDVVHKAFQLEENIVATYDADAVDIIDDVKVLEKKKDNKE